MTAPALLERLSASGATVTASGIGLEIIAPRGAIDARVLADVRAMKPEIIAMLREREYSQPRDVAADALAVLSREVEAARVGSHVMATARVLAAWREAEAATEMPLTLRGETRAPYVREVRELRAGALYDATLATVEVHRAFDAGEVTPAQRDALFQFAADVESAQGASTREKD